MEVNLDALGLLAARRRTSVRFGSTEAGSCVTNVRMKNEINTIADAQVTIDLDRAALPIDYFSMLSISTVSGSQKFPQFLGSIVKAAGSGSVAKIESLSAVSLAEKLVGDMYTRNIPGPEMIYTLARGAGFRESELRIQGIDALPRETFEIIVPIEDLAISKSATFGNITLIPAEMAQLGIAALDVAEDLKERYRATAYAYTLVTASRCLEAEVQGLMKIDLALAWLTTRLRYGMATLPDGRALSFDRSESLAQPRRRDLVAVRGLKTLRQWLRSPEAIEKAQTAIYVADMPRFDPLLPTLTLQERLAVLALARATQERDALARVQALFESIEFYASGVNVSELFSKTDRKAIKDAIPGSLSDAQKKRVGQLIADLNNTPLRVRLAKAMDIDGVPISSEELDLLWKLRQLRNDVVHGRKSEMPISEDVEYGISLVARILVHRIARVANKEALGQA